MQEPLQAREPEYSPVRTSPNAFSLHVSNTPAQGSLGPVWGTSDISYAPTASGYPAVQHLPAQQYLVSPGTIDLSQRQMIDNPEDPKHPDPREYGSEYSERRTLLGGHWISYPTIYEGKRHASDEAYQHALNTGEHLGIYHANTPPAVLDEVENALHSRSININGQLLNGDRWAAMKGKRKISNIVKKKKNVNQSS